MSGGLLARNWRSFASSRAQGIGTEIIHFTEVWVGAPCIALGFGFGTICGQACGVSLVCARM